MKKTIITVLILAASVSVSAQFKFGIKSGVNLSWYSGAGPFSYPSMIAGVVAGGYINYSFTHVIGLQAEALFSQQGTDIVSKEYGFNENRQEEYTDKWRQRVRQNFVNIPLLLEIKPFKKIHLGLLAGVQGGYCVYKKYDGEGAWSKQSEDIIDRIDVSKMKKHNPNWDFGTIIGIQYLSPSHLSVGFQYYLGWLNTGYTHAGWGRTLQLSVGWTF